MRRSAKRFTSLVVILTLALWGDVYASGAAGQARDSFGMWRWGLSSAQWCSLNMDQIMARIDYSGRRNEMVQASNAREPAAMVLIGFARERGRGGYPREGYQAIKYYQAAAVARFPRGMNAYGMALVDGIRNSGGTATETERRQGMAWLSDSAAAGCAIARQNLASLRSARAATRTNYCAESCLNSYRGNPNRSALVDMCLRGCNGGRPY